MAKVCDLLRLPAFKGVHVVAGKSGLSRKVEHVTVMEVPDIKRWLKGNDFLITSFYSVRKSEKEQCQLIESLADICCCVAIKTGQYIDEISDTVKKTADRCGIPLLEIPFHTSYIDLLMNGMSQIFEEENTTRILEKYVRDILYENYTDEILMIERGHLFGFEVDENCFVAVNICFKKKYIPSEQEQLSMRSMGRGLQSYIIESGAVKGCYLYRLEKGFLLLIEGESGKKMEQYLEKCFTTDNVKKYWNGENIPIICGIGPVKTGLKGIRDSYSLSFKAMKVGRTLSKNQFVHFYKRLESFCELEKVLVSSNSNIFTEVLEPIKNHELLETLEKYYECGSNIDQVSDLMFTHRNTTKYRLNRIQELTGLDIKNPDDNFRLYLAVLSMKMRE